MSKSVRGVVETKSVKKLSTKQRARRDERILKLYNEKGLSTRQIAEKVGLSKTRVHEIVAYEN